MSRFFPKRAAMNRFIILPVVIQAMRLPLFLLARI
jgi:hypothetical protein